MNLLMNIILTISILICIATDIRNNKILNVITFPTMIIGLILNIIQPIISTNSDLSIVEGLTHSLVGILTGFALLFIPYMMGGLFAGDVKFLMAVGSFLGWLGTIYSAIYMALVGGVLAILNVFYKNGLKNGFGYLVYLLTFSSYRPAYLTDHKVKEINHSKLPYGIAIGIGALIQMYLR